MKKCQVCKKEMTEFLWHPAGPDPDRRNCFPLSGWHYRGFVAIACCEKCQAEIRSGKDIAFTYKKNSFVLKGQEIINVNA